LLDENIDFVIFGHGRQKFASGSSSALHAEQWVTLIMNKIPPGVVLSKLRNWEMLRLGGKGKAMQ
jgi:hypothetical protein